MSNDGLTLTVADDTMIDDGTFLYLKGIGRREDFGPVEVASKSGSALTLTAAVDWLLGTSGMNAAVPVPSIDIQYRFPLVVETVLLNIDRAAGVGDVTDLAETTDNRGRFNNTQYQRLSNLTSASAGGSIQHERGIIDVAIPAAAGDLVTLTATAYIQEYAAKYATDPATSGIAALPSGHALATRKMGAVAL